MTTRCWVCNLDVGSVEMIRSIDRSLGCLIWETLIVAVTDVGELIKVIFAFKSAMEAGLVVKRRYWRHNRIEIV